MDQRWNRLIVGVALLGLAFGGWSLWTGLDELRTRARSQEEIAKACGGLVDPDKVLSLHGGTLRAQAPDDADDRITAPVTGPDDCVVYRVTGKDKLFGLFQLSIRPKPNERYAHLVGNSVTAPFENEIREGTDNPVGDADVPMDHPLGDGRLGSYTQDSVTMKAVCDTPGDGKLTSVSATALASYDSEKVTAEERKTLAALAREAVQKAAAQLDCSAQLTRPPKNLDPPNRRLGAATAADGTCAWYARFLRGADRGRLPDRFLAAPTSARAWTESCLLALSTDELRRIWPELSPWLHRDFELEPFLRHLPWWMQAESFFGDEATAVTAEGVTDQTPLKPGTAGEVGGANVWWASSTCQGQPALHTLTVAYPYDRTVRADLSAVFRAYVDDVTARRGCTDVKFPSASAFEEAPEVKEPPRGSGRSRTPSSR
ncbi:hypothetical protein [Streptomyces sp. PR69]|uniref:hypothetical protein n=1 Tax=Streptomyces sp. PR69 TaxID=2984950 RepID=UPI0022647BD6|nr:hypothetical protein [Streptomyces sp. PR69]